MKFLRAVAISLVVIWVILFEIILGVIFFSSTRTDGGSIGSNSIFSLSFESIEDILWSLVIFMRPSFGWPNVCYMGPKRYSNPKAYQKAMLSPLPSGVFLNESLIPMHILPTGVQIQTDESKKRVEAKLPVVCDIPCVSGKLTGIKQLWTVYTGSGTKVLDAIFSLEGPQYHGLVRFNSSIKKTFVTTSFLGEVPAPYFSWWDFNIEVYPVLRPLWLDRPSQMHKDRFCQDFPATYAYTRRNSKFNSTTQTQTQPPNGPLNSTARRFRESQIIMGASYLASNCHPKNKRDDFMLEVAKFIRVDSLGKCKKNTAWPAGVPKNKKPLVLQRYALTLAFENQNEHDYITEKLWQPLAAGVVPVYLGAPSVKEYLPPHSVVVAADFKNATVLGQYLRMLLSNRSAYDEYNRWRYEPLPRYFVEKFNFTHVHTQCRLCRLAYARASGLPFNRKTQNIIWPEIK